MSRRYFFKGANMITKFKKKIPIKYIYINPEVFYMEKTVKKTSKKKKPVDTVNATKLLRSARKSLRHNRKEG